jgi:hypothetical protein
MTAELAVCNPDRAAATTCTPPDMLGTSTDQCGCNGLTCAAESRCVSIEDTCSCKPTRSNRCVDTPCATPSDCPAGSACTPTRFIIGGQQGRCLKGCTSDSQCTEGAEGRCSLLYRPPLQGGEYGARLKCVYVCRMGSCVLANQCGNRGGRSVDGALRDPSYYFCPDPSP